MIMNLMLTQCFDGFLYFIVGRYHQMPHHQQPHRGSPTRGPIARGGRGRPPRRPYR